MANGNPSFNNPAFFVGAAEEPLNQTGSSGMARENILSGKSKKMKKKSKKITVKEFHEMVRGMVKESLKRHLSGKLSEQSQPPPVPAQAAGKSVPPPVPQKAIQGNIQTILRKREVGQPLNPQEKRAYLDWLGQEMKTAQTQAKSAFEKSDAGQAIQAVEKKFGQ